MTYRSETENAKRNLASNFEFLRQATLRIMSLSFLSHFKRNLSWRQTSHLTRKILENKNTFWLFKIDFLGRVFTLKSRWSYSRVLHWRFQSLDSFMDASSRQRWWSSTEVFLFLLRFSALLASHFAVRLFKTYRKLIYKSILAPKASFSTRRSSFFCMRISFLGFQQPFASSSQHLSS